MCYTARPFQSCSPTYNANVTTKMKKGEIGRRSSRAFSLVVTSGQVIMTTEYTELQRLLSGVHSIMRVKLTQAGEGGGCTLIPFHYIYHHQ